MTGQQLIELGRELGIQQRIQQDIQLMLLRQLWLRFGSAVNAQAARRIGTASREQLEVWIDRVLSATTLAEVLAD